MPETTNAQRITPAKKKIAPAKVPYRVPEAADLPSGSVRPAVLFLVFDEGYLATGDGDPVRARLTQAEPCTMADQENVRILARDYRLAC